MKRSIGAVALSGLIVGPVLGSGILIFPTLVYRMIHDWAILAWAVISVVGFLVARLFGQLSIGFVGEAGASRAVERVFGTNGRYLSTIFLILGVLFGADAVLLTAAEYVVEAAPIPPVVSASVLLALCGFVLFLDIGSLTVVTLILSVAASLFLFTGATASLLAHRVSVGIRSGFDAGGFFSALFLLFWTVFGWEVIGSYSGEVRRPGRDIPRAVAMSCAIIAVVSMTVAAAVQWTAAPGAAGRSLTEVIRGVYGNAGAIVLAALALFLCGSTTILYIGALSRQVASLADDGVLPRLFARRLGSGVAHVGLSLLLGINAAVMVAIGLGWIGLRGLVQTANGFLVANALISIASAVLCVKGMGTRVGGAIVAVAFFGLLIVDSPRADLIVIGVLTLFFLARRLRGPRGGRRAEARGQRS